MTVLRRWAWAWLVLCFAVFAGSEVANAQASPSAYTWATRYDLLGRVTAAIAPDPDGAGTLKFAAVRNTYDIAGRLTLVETGELSAWQSETVAPSAWGASFTVLTSAATTYDGLNRKIKDVVTGSDAVVVSVTQYSYDTVGRLECTAVRMNPAIYGSLPASACTLGTVGTNGPDRISKNVYDAAGQLMQVRKGVGSTLELADATYTYSANGKRQYVIDANGNKAELRYDGFDRQSRWVLPSTTGPTGYSPNTPANAVATAGALNEADYEAYTYDANGNRLTARKRDSSTITYSYDALDRVTTKVVPERSGLGTTHTRDVYYGYDAMGRQTFARYDSATGEGVTSAYDGFGQLTSSTLAMDSQSRQLSYLYDKDGGRTRITWPDSAFVSMAFDGMDRQAGLSDASSATLTTIAYNNRGSSATVNRAGTAFDQSITYDPAGRLSNLSVTDGTAGSRVAWAFTRNPGGQIATETRDNDGYAWTGHVNVTRPYSTNGLNQYSTAGPAAFCYDANGNLIADGSSVYLYDVENRLVEKRVQTNSVCSSLSYTGTLQASLRYDPLGRLYEVTGAATTRFLYDGDALVAEFNTGGTLLRRYAHGSDAGADDPAIWFEGTSALAANARHLYVDPRGSIVLVGDASGTAVALDSYDEYGIPGTANAGRFQYTGQAWLTEAGMYYYKARMYSPTLGRFMQTDPIGYDDQINLYAYVANDPVNGVDPTGTEGIVDDAVAWGKMVVSDLGELAEGISEGRLEWAFGGMPPQLGGGVVSESMAVARAATALRAEVAATRAAPAATRGGENAAAAAGRQAHRELAGRVAQKPGWKSEPRMTGADGKTYKPDVVTPRGRIMELKPDTASGRAAGARQTSNYSTQLGAPARTITYRPPAPPPPPKPWWKFW